MTKIEVFEERTLCARFPGTIWAALTSGLILFGILYVSDLSSFDIILTCCEDDGIGMPEVPVLRDVDSEGGDGGLLFGASKV
jgi:hypothetical protein